jgi:hypothetical protein
LDDRESATGLGQALRARKRPPRRQRSQEWSGASAMTWMKPPWLSSGVSGDAVILRFGHGCAVLAKGFRRPALSRSAPAWRSECLGPLDCRRASRICPALSPRREAPPSFCAASVRWPRLRSWPLHTASRGHSPKARQKKPQIPDAILDQPLFRTQATAAPRGLGEQQRHMGIAFFHGALVGRPASDAL